jgi:hypothetical protein
LTELDRPSSVEDLYEDRGEVPLSIPLMQGDVFGDVTVLGLSDSPIEVMITAHPCSMRRGTVLADRIGVAPVRIHQHKVNEKAWAGHGNVMLLPDLKEGGTNYSADFRDITSVSGDELSLKRRVAVLSPDGLLILQQRLINFMSRFRVPVSVLAEQNSCIFTEMELQRDWVEGAIASLPSDDVMEGIVKAEIEFHSWLDDNGGDRRNKLKQVQNHASIRREAREEIRNRYS